MAAAERDSSGVDRDALQVEPGGHLHDVSADRKLEQLADLPPALVIVDENDVLRDGGEAYARRLIEAGVPTTSVRYDAIIHDFMMLDLVRGTEAPILRKAFGS